MRREASARASVRARAIPAGTARDAAVSRRDSVRATMAIATSVIEARVERRAALTSMRRVGVA